MGSLAGTRGTTMVGTTPSPLPVTGVTVTVTAFHQAPALGHGSPVTTRYVSYMYMYIHIVSEVLV